MSKIIVLSVLAMLSACSAYKILLVFPYPATSHQILGGGYVRHLLDAGHEVTFLTCKLLKQQHKNLRQIELRENFKLFEDQLQGAFNFEFLINNSLDMSDLMPVMYKFMHDIANSTLRNHDVQNLINDPDEHFDLVIAEWMYSELYSGLAPVFNCPLIWSSSMEVHGQILTLIDEDPNPAYTADHVSTTHPPFTFSERLHELTMLLYRSYMKWKFHDLNGKTFVEAYGAAIAKRGRKLPSFEEAAYNASLVLGNSHVSLGQAISLPQNYIPIAGYHIEDDVKPLTKDIQKIMDEAKHGVIYFSMGSIMKSTTMPDVLKTGLLELFGTLKQTVIWKFEENLPNTPKNVHIMNWTPQQSILAHPNCVLFISHGGLLSTTEALHYGVPIIGIPIFADQHINVVRAVRKGFAIQVPLGYDTHVHLKTAIKEMFENLRYRTRAKELSFIYHHRPAPPGAELVHWVEHTIRTSGALHLRSPALHVPFYQKVYLDLALVVVVVLYLLVKVLGVAKTIVCSKVKEKMS